MTLKQISIIFILFSVIMTKDDKTKPVVVEGMFDQLREDIFKPKECYPKVMENMSSKEAINESIMNSSEMKQICPNIIHSCCTQEMMIDINNEIQLNYKKMTSMIDIISHIVKSIQSMTPENIEALRKRFSNSKKSMADEEDEETLKFWRYINYFIENGNDVLEEVENGIEYYSDVVSRFGCTICDQETHASFVHNKHKSPAIRFDYAQCKTMFEHPSAENYIKSVSVIARLYFIFEKYDSIFPEQFFFKKKDFFDPENYDEVKEGILTCNKESNFMSNNSCVSLCNEQKLTGYNTLFEYGETLIIFSYFTDNFFLGKELPDTSQMQEIHEANKEKYLVYSVLKPVNSENLIFDQVNLKKEWGSGINVVDHEFYRGSDELNQDKNKSSRVVLKGSQTEFIKNISSMIILVAFIGLFINKI